jgi:DNA gyrase subunit A
VADLRVFASRNSMGVRGISLGAGEKVISLAVLSHVGAGSGERQAYLKRVAAERRAQNEDAVETPEDAALVGEDVVDEVELSDERYEELRRNEQFVLTVSEKGFGKRSSSYDFRLTNRGGKGIRATDTSQVDRIGNLVAGFAVDHGDEIMLVSDGGQVIRVPVDGIRIASRATKGVRIFNTAEGEKVVSVERISDPTEQAATGE